MKKEHVFLISLLLLSLIANMPLSHADDTPQANIPGIGNINPDNLPKDTESLKQTSSSYLNQEWRKIFENNPLGKILVEAWDYSKPVLTVIIGVKAEFSWRFFFAIMIWLMILFIIASLFSFISILSKGWNWLIALVATIMLGASKVIDNMIIFIDKITAKWWLKLIVLIFIAIIIVLSKVLSKIAKEKQEKQAKEEEETNRKALKATVEGVTGQRS